MLFPACSLNPRGFDPPCYSLSLSRDLVHRSFPPSLPFLSSPFRVLFSLSRPRSLSLFLIPFAFSPLPNRSSLALSPNLRGFFTPFPYNYFLFFFSSFLILFLLTIPSRTFFSPSSLIPLLLSLPFCFLFFFFFSSFVRFHYINLFIMPTRYVFCSRFRFYPQRSINCYFAFTFTSD